jgi:hypothetical protein
MVNRKDAMGPRIERLPRGCSYVLSQTYFCERPSLFAKTIHPRLSYFRRRKMLGAKDRDSGAGCRDEMKREGALWMLWTRRVGEEWTRSRNGWASKWQEAERISRCLVNVLGVFVLLGVESVTGVTRPRAPK